MRETQYDIVAIGNAIVDVIASTSDDFIAREGIAKGSMRLVDPATADSLYARMGPGIETSGGSVANTLAGIAALGGRCAFIGQVANDQFGGVFRHDMHAMGIHFDTPPLPGSLPTGRCLILVAPDGQRTMNTALGASHHLIDTALNTGLIEAAAIFCFEGYMWEDPEPRTAIRQAMALARAAGRRIAFTLSDAFCIDRHRADFQALILGGEIDILFANIAEMAALHLTDDIDVATRATAAHVPLLVVTHGANGAIAIERGKWHRIRAEPVARVIDTTGAGDMFAAGFLSGLIADRPVPEALRMGAIAAAEVIGHIGPRPQADLRTLIDARMKKG